MLTIQQAMAYAVRAAQKPAAWRLLSVAALLVFAIATWYWRAIWFGGPACFAEQSDARCARRRYALRVRAAPYKDPASAVGLGSLLAYPRLYGALLLWAIILFRKPYAK